MFNILEYSWSLIGWLLVGNPCIRRINTHCECVEACRLATLRAGVKRDKPDMIPVGFLICM